MSYTETRPRRSLWPTLWPGLLLALSGLALVVVPAWAGKAPVAPAKAAPTASWPVIEAAANVEFNSLVLEGLGLAVVDVESSITGHTPHPLSVAAAGTPWFRTRGEIALRAAVAADGFHGFEGGSLRVSGGFGLRGTAGNFVLSDFTLRPGKTAGTLELVDSAGVAMLGTWEPQWEFNAQRGVVRYLNADLRILPAFARLLGDERYTGTAVGVFALDATLRIGSVPKALAPVSNVPPPCGDWTGNVDVGLTNMSNIGQAGIATVNGRSVVVVLPSADLKNVGTANVPWYSKFTNLGVPPWNDQHPFLVWQMTRSSGGVFEPIGRSDLKHAFLTLNNGCDAGACTDSHVLGLGCTDVYSTGTNNSVGSLAPRPEVTASTATWNHCGGVPSHFDTNGDCVQDFSGSGENAFTHGLKAAETDLQVAGSSYYVEAFYIIKNDVNIFNSMGYRQVTPTKVGSTWTFPLVGGYTQGPPINAWVNPTTPGPNADNRSLDTGHGHLQLATRVSDVVGSPGQHRYAYALQNHDFDPQIKSFRVPFDTTVGTITNIAYADGDGFAANDWTATTDATGITWTAPAATTPPAEIDYASVVSFHFDSDLTASPSTASMGVFEVSADYPAGSQLMLTTLAPGGASYYTVAPCRLIDTRSTSSIASGVGRDFAVAGVCGVPANAVAVAINVTAVDATSDGDIAVYATGAPSNLAAVSFRAGITRANNAVSMLSPSGGLTIRPTLSAPGSTNALVDVVGYFLRDTP